MSDTFNPNSHVNLPEKIINLANELNIPAPVIASVGTAIPSISNRPLAELAKPTTAQKAWEDISAQTFTFAQDSGMSLLAATLGGACFSRIEYQKQGICNDVFLATMKCLPRFLKETYEITGSWGFDRGFWTWRQTGGLLFRLGTLEFEYRFLETGEPLPDGLNEGDPVISVHIPSDANLTSQQLAASYTWAKDFFYRQIPGPWTQAQPKAIVCGSWLLSPDLYKLLPDNSGIRRFAGSYHYYDVQKNDNAIYRWLFQLPSPVPAKQLPERTRLQSSVKKHLLGGGQIGMARGILMD